MPHGASALQLVFGGDPALYAIVALSLYVSLSAVLLAALVALPFGAFLALTNFPGRGFIVVVTNAFMGGSVLWVNGRRPFRADVERKQGPGDQAVDEAD